MCRSAGAGEWCGVGNTKSDTTPAHEWGQPGSSWGDRPFAVQVTGVILKVLERNNSKVCGFTVTSFAERLPSFPAPFSFLVCECKLRLTVIVGVK